MRKLKYKLFVNDWYSDLTKVVNEFLDTIDAVQVVKIESFDRHWRPCSGGKYCCAITYLELEDVRDIKLEMLVK
jgi:hypothetical protein